MMYMCHLGRVETWSPLLVLLNLKYYYIQLWTTCPLHIFIFHFLLTIFESSVPRPILQRGEENQNQNFKIQPVAVVDTKLGTVL